MYAYNITTGAQRKKTTSRHASVKTGGYLMINRSPLLLTVVLLATGLGLSAACAQETVNLGLVLPESGSSGDYVKRHMMEPTIFAAKEINEQGGLLGKKVQVINEDATDPTSAVSALRKLVDVNHVLAVFSAWS